MIASASQMCLVVNIFYGMSTMATAASDNAVKYHFQVTDRPHQRRFVLTLQSADKRPICIYRDKWPNGFGQLHSGSRWVFLKSSGGTLPARDTNFGICGGDASCYIRILPSGKLSGFIGYEQFGKPEQIAKLPRRELHFPVSPFVCVEWPPRQARPAPKGPLGKE
jgi:hypothetical protein